MLAEVLNPATFMKSVMQTMYNKFQWPREKEETQVVRLSFPTLISIVLLLSLIGYVLYRMGSCS